MKVSLELRVSWRAWIGDEYAACGMGIVDRSSGRKSASGPSADESGGKMARRE